MKFISKKSIIVGSVAAALGGSCIYPFGPRFFHKTESPRTEESDFIYLPGNYNLHPGVHPKEKWLKFIHFERRLHWQLLKQAQSENRRLRHAAVEALADLNNLLDSDYCEIAQAADLITSVALARNPQADLRFFLSPPPVPQEYLQESLQSNLHDLLSSLPYSSNDKTCVNYFTQNALKTKVTFGDLEDKAESPRLRASARGEIEKYCLQALLSHSNFKEHRKMLVKNGVLQILLRVIKEHPKEESFHSLIAQMLGNFALDSSLHKEIFMAGWVGMLAKWLRSSDARLSLPAARALANMDEDSVWHVPYDSGIYLLHPSCRKSKNDIKADIIFVHGLLGSVFKTWRQHDSQNPNPVKPIPKAVMEAPESNMVPIRNKIFEVYSHDYMLDKSLPYTNCWPKDWLAKDIPNVRILAVDYDTYLSQWSPKCPLELDRRTLHARGREMLQKFEEIGVGERPVIWISHSMGGLLVKQILVEAEYSKSERQQEIAKQTAGISFYSVPHKGVNLADKVTPVKLLLLPSVEVKDLKKDSPHLLYLHEKFEELAKKLDIPCVSFGESEKTKLGLRLSSLLVSRESSDPGFGDFFVISAMHLDTCKPYRWSSCTYQILLDFLEHCLSSIVVQRGSPNRMSGVLSDKEFLIASGFFL